VHVNKEADLILSHLPFKLLLWWSIELKSTQLYLGKNSLTKVDYDTILGSNKQRIILRWGSRIQVWVLLYQQRWLVNSKTGINMDQIPQPYPYTQIRFTEFE